MWEASYPFFAWHSSSWLGQAISNSVWMFPAIETIHILAMAVMFGALLVLNIKLLGLGFGRQHINLLGKTLMPFANWGLGIMLVSGYMMFASEAIKCFSNDGFKFKMASLALVLIFQYTLYRGLVLRGTNTGILGGFYALVNFALWFGVGAGGRAIGFV